MRKGIEIQGMGIDINYRFDSKDNVVINYVNDFWDSEEFLMENEAIYNIAYTGTITDFYQLSHREQCEIIKEMIEDKIDDYKEELYPTKDDYHFNMEINAGI